MNKITIIQSELRLLSKLLKTGERNSDSNLMEWSSTKSGARFALFRSFAIESSVIGKGRGPWAV